MYGFLKQASRRYFDNAPHHRNPLVRKAADYLPCIPDPATDASLHSSRFTRGRFTRRPRNVLSDPDDEITATIERWATVHSSDGAIVSLPPAGVDLTATPPHTGAASS